MMVWDWATSNTGKDVNLIYDADGMMVTRKGQGLETTAWRFSSAAYWLMDPPGETDVKLTGIDW